MDNPNQNKVEGEDIRQRKIFFQVTKVPNPDDFKSEFNSSLSSTTPTYLTGIHLAAQEGNVAKLEAFLRSGTNPNVTDSLGRTPLHYAIFSDSCISLLLSHQSILLDPQDLQGQTPLHLAIQNKLKASVQLLISAGADVCLPCGNSGEDAVTLLVKYLPSTLTYLLDECIFVSSEEHGPMDENCVLKVDLSPLVGSPKFCVKSKKVPGTTPDEPGGAAAVAGSGYGDPGPVIISWQREMSLLLKILRNPVARPWRHPILTHPVTQIFLEQEWLRARKFYYGYFIFYLIYTLVYTSYIINLYLMNCPLAIFLPDNITHNYLNPDMDDGYPNYDNFIRTEDHPESQLKCEEATGSVAEMGVVLALTVFLALTELFSLIISGPLQYLRNWFNIGTWVYLALVIFTTEPNWSSQKNILFYQYQAAGLNVFLAWAYMLQQVSRFPFFGKYIELFVVVCNNYGFLSLTFVSLFIGFAVAFSVLLPTRLAFRHLLSSFHMIFVMFTGEINYNTHMYSEPENIKANFMAHFLFGIFTFVLQIVLWNVIIALAVQDVQELQQNGEQRRMTRLIKERARLEDIIFSERFPSVIGEWVKASISVLQPTQKGRQEGLVFEFKPNSREQQGDSSIPENLKEEVLKLATISFRKQRAEMKCKKLVEGSRGNELGGDLFRSGGSKKGEYENSFVGAEGTRPPRRLSLAHFQHVANQSSITKNSNSNGRKMEFLWLPQSWKK